MKKKILLISLLILILALVIFLILKINKKDPNILTLYGNVEIRQVDLSSRVEARVKKLYKEEGDAVKKGELVALLDDTVYSARYKKSLADVKTYAASERNANANFNRNILLCKENVTSKEECDLLLRQKQEGISRLKSQIEQTKIYKDDFENTRIYAPNDGIISVRVAEEGTVVKSSDPIYTLTLNKPIWIRAFVLEKDLGNIKYGTIATVLTDSIDPVTNERRKYKGRVGYISPVAEFTPKTVQTTDLRVDLVYRIRVYVDVVDEFLRQGMPTTVEIDLRQNKKAD